MFDWSSSGAMYAGVPLALAPAAVAWVAAVLRSSDLESPKSVTLQRPLSSRSTFSVFKSRCSTFFVYK